MDKTYQERKDKAAFDLFLAFHAGAHHWTAEFFKLVAKSDFSHRYKLRQVFPIEVTIWEEWQASESEKNFFGKHQIERFFANGDDRKRYERFSGG